MNILITNDDGIHAPALPYLIRWARSLGEVTCVAPKTEQSGKSQAIDFTRAVEIKPAAIAPDVTVYAMDSTPADCVRFGVLGLGQTYDLVLSGINRGYNLGDDIAYSGTVGAILEGARMGLPGLALSAEPDSAIDAVHQLDRLYAFIQEHGLMNQHSLYNINFPPASLSRGVRITRQGGMFFSDGFERREGDLYQQVGAPVHYDRCDLSLDMDAVRAGYISVTPITASRTEHTAFEALKALGEG